MNESQHNIVSKSRKNKIKEVTSIKIKQKSKRVKFSSLPKSIYIISCLKNLFLSLINKINNFFTDCSFVIQLPLSLIPISIIMMISLYIIHISFYNEYYVFNISKTIKEEFHDLYITKIDDLNVDLTAISIKENKLELENQLFFQVYFKELTLNGVLSDEENDPFLSKFNDEDFYLFSELNYYKGLDVNFTISPDYAINQIEERYYDKLGEFCKIYYYMFPYLWYESYYTNSLINQSFFIAYELDFEDCEWMFTDYPLYFRYPKNSEGLIENNFIPSNFYLNPNVDPWYTGHNYMFHDYYFENWFITTDYNFRCSINGETDLLDIKNMFAHINYENNININKAFITISHQYIKVEERGYVITIIHYLNQTDLKQGDIDYTSFIIEKNNNTFIENIEDIIDTEEEDEQEDSDDDWDDDWDDDSEEEEEEKILNIIGEKYSDNTSYVLTLSDSTEYSMSEIDYALFHLGLYDHEYDFYANCVYYDSFILGYLYDYTDSYTISKGGEYDFKYFVTLYLYKSLFQTIFNFTKIEKEKEKIFLYHFNDKDKIQHICQKINFTSYKTYLKYSGINCWDERNQLYYDIETFMYIKIVNYTNKIDPIYPYCSCLPLYCLKNYKSIDFNIDNLSNLEFSDEINLPNKCQNKFTYFDIKDENLVYEENRYNKILKLAGFAIKQINYDYVKFIFLELNRLPEYFFFLIAHIKVSGENYFHTYNKFLLKIEIIISVIFISLSITIISIILLYQNLKKYSLIISKFKQKYELYIFHSLENRNESNLFIKYKLGKYIRNKRDIKNEDRLKKDIKKKKIEKIDSSITKDFYNINDNDLFNDLFVIFKENYNINRNDVERFLTHHKHKSKNLVRLNMMNEKNELFELLSSFTLYAPFFQLNINFDFDMYEYSKIMKKYNDFVEPIKNKNKVQARLTENVLYELISTECISDYGLVTNLDFKYVTNKNASLTQNSIQYTLFGNIKHKQIKKDDKHKQDNEEDSEKKHTKKLILKRKNILLDIYKKRFESDEFLNYNKIDNAFNFFLINSFYKYQRQIGKENNDIS